MRVYLAAPLFGIAEREFNKCLAIAIMALDSQIKVLLPQVKAQEIPKDDSFPANMFDWCLNSINMADAVLAVFDGPDADSGTCIECGYAFARRIPIIGIRTDLRGSEVQGVNIMVEHVCRKLIVELDVQNSVSEIAKCALDALRNIPPSET